MNAVVCFVAAIVCASVSPAQADVLTDGFLGEELNSDNFTVQNYSIPFVDDGTFVGGLNAPGSGTTSIVPTVSDSVLTLAGAGPSNFFDSFDNGIAVVGTQTASLPGLDTDPLLLTARGVTATTLDDITTTGPQWEVGVGIYSDSQNFVTLSIVNFVGTSATQTNLRTTIVSNGVLTQSNSAENILSDLGTDSATEQTLQIEITDEGDVRFIASNASGTYFDFASPTGITPGFFGTTRPILYATSQRPETGVAGTFGSVTFPEDVFVLDVIPEPATGSVVMAVVGCVVMLRRRHSTRRARDLKTAL